MITYIWDKLTVKGWKRPSLIIIYVLKGANMMKKIMLLFTIITLFVTTIFSGSIFAVDHNYLIKPAAVVSNDYQLLNKSALQSLITEMVLEKTSQINNKVKNTNNISFIQPYLINHDFATSTSR